jgi:ABC-type Na+ efflux pump permease subunit
VRAILVYSLPLWLLLLGIVLLFTSARPILRRKTLDLKQAQFKSLRTASPILNTLVMTSVVGKPFLEHIQKNNWDTSFLAPQIAMPLVAVFTISLYALLAAVLFFFFRAIQNINVLSGERRRSPYSALFMLIPISN